MRLVTSHRDCQKNICTRTTRYKIFNKNHETREFVTCPHVATCVWCSIMSEVIVSDGMIHLYAAICRGPDYNAGHQLSLK